MIRDSFFEIASNARGGKYGDEDLLTDLFGTLLTLDWRLACAWFGTLCGDTATVVEVETQPAFPEFPYGDSPDLSLKSEIPNQQVIICEHKVDSPLGPRQLERYLQLADAERKRTKVPHHVALVSRTRMSLTTEVTSDPNFLRAPERPHFLWQDVYSVVERLYEAEPDKGMTVAKLRRHFLDYLESCRLSPPQIPPRTKWLFWPEGPEEEMDANVAELAKGEQASFGRIWDRVEEFFRDRGFQCQRASRKDFMAYATAISEIPKASGLEVILGKITKGDTIPRGAPIERPCIEIWVNCEAEKPGIIKAIPADQALEIKAVETVVSVAVGDARHSKNRPSKVFWLALKPVLDSVSRPDALRAVVETLYSDVVLQAWRHVRKGGRA